MRPRCSRRSSGASAGRPKREFRALGLGGALDYDLTADMRFVGQAFEIPVAVDPARLSGIGASDLAADFDAAHRRIYFHGGEPGRKVEIVGLRLRRPAAARGAAGEP